MPELPRKIGVIPRPNPTFVCLRKLIQLKSRHKKTPQRGFAEARVFGYSTYKIVHLAGIFLVFMSLAPPIVAQLSQSTINAQYRKWVMVNHGLGLVLSLVGGFGLLARLDIIWPWPSWVLIKLGLWFIAGGLIAGVLRAPQLAKVWWFLLVSLGIFAVAAVNLRAI